MLALELNTLDDENTSPLKEDFLFENIYKYSFETL